MTSDGTPKERLLRLAQAVSDELLAAIANFEVLALSDDRALVARVPAKCSLSPRLGDEHRLLVLARARWARLQMFPDLKDATMLDVLTARLGKTPA